MHDLLKILLATVLSFVTMYILAKIMGKRQIAQLDFVDYVVGITIGSIAAEMCTETELPLYNYVLAMVVFALLAIIVTLLERKGIFLKRLFKGKPLVIIYEGKLNYKNLKKSRMDLNDIIMLCRVRGYFDLSKIYYLILETDGNISIAPAGEYRPAVIQDVNKELIKKPTLPNYLVVDGHIAYSTLTEINKDVEWLMKELNAQNKKELKNIILALYDNQTQRVIIHTKK